MVDLCRNLDVAVFVVGTLVHLAAWWEYRSPAPIPEELERRQLGVETMSGTATAGLTAVSILIPASLLVIQLGRDEGGASLPASALDEVFRGTLWLLLSLILGLMVIYFIPTRAHKYDVSHDLKIGGFYFPQLLALLLGVWHVVFGLKQAIYP